MGNEKERLRRSRTIRGLTLRISGVSGGVFLTLVSAADQIERWLPGPPQAWFIGGPIIAGWWAYEVFRVGGDDGQQR